jgi:hypothetical protein
LERGSPLMTKEGTVVRVDSAKQRRGEFKVHNFEVAESHTYFVSGARVLVHNKCPEVFGGEVPENRLLDLAEKYLGPGYREASPGRFV